eukprot:PLAT10609.1.p2 GENE.PLAT10609.1~~PLAT10609.1.p2  ORF type:complete len:434 (-),score=200.51 PLAT10609.1:107-1309(-)
MGRGGNLKKRLRAEAEAEVEEEEIARAEREGLLEAKAEDFGLDSDDEMQDSYLGGGSAKRMLLRLGKMAPEDYRPRKRMRFPRVLLLSSRGLTASTRFLIKDIQRLLPHHKRDVKFDNKTRLAEIASIAEMKGCQHTVFFETRRRKELYLWLARMPAGPSVRFQVQNVHTMNELKLTGNCLLGARVLLNFDAAFDAEPHWRLLREMLTQIFATPAGHPKSKPFVDHVMSFMIADNRIWVRHYQIADGSETTSQELRALKSGKDLLQLVEIGPRFVLNVVRIFAGAFGGPTLYQNPEYVSPSEARRRLKKIRAMETRARLESRLRNKRKHAAMQSDGDELSRVFAGEGDVWDAADSDEDGEERKEDDGEEPADDSGDEEDDDDDEEEDDEEEDDDDDEDDE